MTRQVSYSLGEWRDGFGEMGVNLAGVTIIMDLLQKLREVQEEKQALLAMREALETRLAASPSRHSTSV